MFHVKRLAIISLTPQAARCIVSIMDIFSAPHFRDDEAARKFLEGLLWPQGPVCPHCGVLGHAYETKRAGVYRCAEKECRKDFTVTMKTVMERSHIALHKWLQGFHLMASSKKGISAHQLHRSLDITYRSAWFMAHRIREAMRAGGLAPMGGAGSVVEADETFIGRKESSIKRRGQTAMMTDEGGHYFTLGDHFASHERSATKPMNTYEALSTRTLWKATTASSSAA